MLKLEVSWALGASYHLLNTYRAQEADQSVVADNEEKSTRGTCQSAPRSTSLREYVELAASFLSDTATYLLSLFRLVS